MTERSPKARSIDVRRPAISWCAAALLIIALPLTSGCSTVRQGGGQELTGFLSHYDRMEPPSDGLAAYWADPDFELADYDAALITEIEIWDKGRWTTAGASVDAQRLASLFQDRLTDALQESGWRMTDESGPRTLEIQVALTELEGTNSLGNLLTRAPYPTSMAVKLAGRAGGAEIFVGSAAAELRLVDSVSGEVLAEAYDRGVGNNSVVNIGSTWADVNDVLTNFARRIGEGLDKTSSTND